MRQRERTYSLVVGDYQTGNGLLIETLQMAFDVSKVADNKNNNGNSASIEIYNLNPSQIALLDTQFIDATLSVGYRDIGNRVLVSGNVMEVVTRKSGDDYVTQLTMGEGYSDLNHNKLKGVVSPGSTVADVIEAIRKEMPSVARGSVTGTNLNNPVVSGWRLSGTPREALKKLCEANQLEYNITGNVLNTTDVNGVFTKDTVNCPVLNEVTGLIETPFHILQQAGKSKKDKRRRKGMQFKALLNPMILPGAIVKLESPVITGFYRVNAARFSGDFRGNDWTVECTCSEIAADELE
ncbi:hypothetical protein ATI02_5964 [Pseudomonas baetica]|uniref:Late control protein n=1 Tax=Pseudomonas baetica TaxID=674054 RepID=A0ABX4Q7U5_9PSED|nr:hypothetical protein [Pseudomonas baetica]PKA72863.1 hypothetical protein ATI02_5964 [Pseudomonas baetica]PTC19018.1 hypothetical protein C0J26_11290 [Pseudomonas baetica]